MREVRWIKDDSGNNPDLYGVTNRNQLPASPWVAKKEPAYYKLLPAHGELTL